MATAVPAVAVCSPASVFADGEGPKIMSGPFEGTRESLKAYRIPEWFRDAKFGIWAHWGPQSAPEQGDWYARNMYLQDTRQYKYHVEHYGHPSRFGFKDVIHTWKGEHFDADHLVGLYRKAGAKYFMSMGVHCDRFNLWQARHSRWNAAKMGPKQDIVKAFRKATLKHGLRFGVSEHSWCSYKWFSVARGSDLKGPLAGVSYDGANPNDTDLYGDCPIVYRDLPWNEEGIPEKCRREWFANIKDLIDQAEPDIFYCDGKIPFETWGLSLVAHLYNQNAQRHGGDNQAVFTSKGREDVREGLCVLDRERGMAEGIRPAPWQMCTCIGDWHYQQDNDYKTPKRVIDILVDTVSRNGNLLLNFPLRSNGTLDADEMKILDEITAWMAVNGEAIHGTRPWKVAGEGPNTVTVDPKKRHAEDSRKDFTADDVRFTTKGGTLYAFFMGWPDRELLIAPLARDRSYLAGKILDVELVGFRGKVTWKHADEGLRVQLPTERPSRHACALKITGLETQPAQGII